VGIYAGLISGSTLAVFVWVLAYRPAQAVTMSFMTLALAQIFHLGNARSDRTVLQPRRALANPAAIGAVVVSIVLQIAPTEIAPVAGILRVASLGRGEWGMVLAFSSIAAVAGQAVRLVAASRSARP
jgi:Ca2+-transporting ATPase